MQIRRSYVALVIISSLFVAAIVFAQRQLARDNYGTTRTSTKQAPSKGDTSIVPASAPQMLLTNPDALEFERTIVADSPFSATMIIETSERMPTGALPTKITSYLIYRDSKGRTRRERLPEPLSSTTVEPTRSVINDSVAGFIYDLDHRSTSAQRKALIRLPARNSAAIETASKEASGRNQILPMPSSFGTGTINLRTKTSDAAPKVPESLGTREIEGVLAEGTRISFTLPAGTAGNDNPVEIVAERWYAPALQTVILVKQTDSRTGETTHRVTKINRSEPAAALFTVPPNYKIHDEKGREVPNNRKTP